MRKPVPRVVRYKHSSTSKYVVEGWRENGNRKRVFFQTKAEAETWLALKLTYIRGEVRFISGKLNAISPGDIQNRKYWAISDLDSARVASGNNLPGSTIITSPIHVTFHNQLFFDLHAERVPYP